MSLIHSSFIIPVTISFFVYYESIKRELKRRLIYEYRCDERLKLKMRNLHVSQTLGWSFHYESIKWELKRRLEQGSSPGRSQVRSQVSGTPWPVRPDLTCFCLEPLTWDRDLRPPGLGHGLFFAFLILLLFVKKLTRVNIRDVISLEKFVKWNEMKCRVSNFKWIEMKWNVTHSSTVDVKWKLMKLFFTNDHEWGEMKWNSWNWVKLDRENQQRCVWF
jgi:hypothetical protein